MIGCWDWKTNHVMNPVAKTISRKIKGVMQIYSVSLFTVYP